MERTRELSPYFPTRPTSHTNTASHLLSVPAGTRLISEALMSSPILSADLRSGIPDELMPGNDGPAASGSGGNDFEFGVDPSLDPELAMVRV